VYVGIFASIYEEREGRSLKKGREGEDYNIYEMNEIHESIRNKVSCK
jgi:hypothetical protein